MRSLQHCDVVDSSSSVDNTVAHAFDRAAVGIARRDEEQIWNDRRLIRLESEFRVLDTSLSSCRQIVSRLLVELVRKT